MLNLTVENKYGHQLNLSSSPDYSLLKVGGITPPQATINTSNVATKDGSIFNSSRIENRNITLLIAPKNNIEKARVNIYWYIKSKQYIKLYLKNGSRNVWIDGYVESIEGDLYENPQMIQVSIICPDPFFKNMEKSVIEFSNTVPAFTFPVSVEDGYKIPISTQKSFTEVHLYNSGDEETGVIIELRVTGLALEPTIYNVTTNEYFTIEYELYAGDLITINTKRGEKSVKLTRDGKEINIINHMAKGSKWINLICGDNVFTYSAIHAPESIKVGITLQPIYEGV